MIMNQLTCLQGFLKVEKEDQTSTQVLIHLKPLPHNNFSLMSLRNLFPIQQLIMTMMVNGSAFLVKN